MATPGKITRKDILDDNVLNIGIDYEKSLRAAIAANQEWVATFRELRDIALEYRKISESFKLPNNYREFIEVKKQEEDLNKRALELAKKEEEFRAKKLKADQEVVRLTNLKLESEKKLEDILNKRLAAEKKTIDIFDKKERIARRTNKLTEEEKENNRILAREKRLLAKISSDLTTAYEKQDARLQLLTRRYKGIAVEFGRNSKEAQKLKREMQSLRQKLFEVDKEAGNFFRNVGNYPKNVGLLVGSFKRLTTALIGAFGIVEGIRLAFNFAKEARQLALDAQGIEFAFKRLGDAGADAFNRIKISTRGTLSDLDIKKSLVELDNFNISLEESDVLMEFLAVRASQTGDSIERLRDSLIEGLSKESKLRIDNLGISTAELNKELEKTPNFVQAVANIAKRELKDAGNILDDAADSQAKFNAEFQNFKLSVGSGFVARASSALFDFGTNLLRAINPSQKLTNSINEQRLGLNDLVVSILNTNESEEDRKDLINELIDQYPFFLRFVKDEKLDNDSLKKSLAEVNGLYIKRLALQRAIEKLNVAGKQEKLADETARTAKIEDDYQKVLTATNLFLNRNTLDTDVATRSVERQNESLKESLEFNINRITQLKAQGKATDAQIKNLTKYENKLNSLAEATRIFNNANSRLGFAETAVQAVTREIEELERALGLTQEELDDLFNPDSDPVTITVDLSDLEKARKERERFLKKLREDEFQLQKFDIEQRIEVQRRIVDNDLASFEVKKFAIEEQAELEITLSRVTAEKKLKDVSKLNEEEIKEFLETGTLRVNAEKKITDELLLVYRKYISEVDEANRDRDDATDSLVIQRIQTEAQIVADVKKQQLNEELRLEQEAFNRREGIYSNERTAVELHEKKVAAIQKKFALEALQTQIDVAEAILEARTKLGNLSPADEERLKAQIAELRAALAKLRGDLEEDFVSLPFNRIVDLAQNATQAITSIFQAGADARIQAIDAEIEKNEEKYDRLLAAEELTDERRKALERRREADQRKLEQKRKEEQRKQAVATKAISVLEITLNTASAIVEALPNIPLSVAVGLIGALQLGAALATPIPQFAEGHYDGTYQGWAITNDAIREFRPVKEVHESAGKAKVIQGKNTPIYMKKGDIVHKSVEDYENLRKAAIVASVHADNHKLNQFKTTHVFNNAYDSKKLEDEMREMNRNLKKLKLNPNIYIQSPKQMDLAHELWKLKRLS